MVTVVMMPCFSGTVVKLDTDAVHYLLCRYCELSVVHSPLI